MYAPVSKVVFKDDVLRERHGFTALERDGACENARLHLGLHLTLYDLARSDVWQEATQFDLRQKRHKKRKQLCFIKRLLKSVLCKQNLSKYIYTEVQVLLYIEEECLFDQMFGPESYN